MHRLALIAVASSFGIAAPVLAQPAAFRPDAPALTAPPPCPTGALPEGHLFEPLRGDPHTPRFAGGLARMVSSEGQITDGDDQVVLGIVALGGTLGLYRSSDRDCNGIQLSFGAGVVSLFEMHRDRTDLLNADYRAELPLEMRRGPLSARVRLVHQSSHIGDELLLARPEFIRENLSFEYADGVAAVGGRLGRVYGGGGVILHKETPLGRKIVFAGAELGGSDPGLTPTLAVHWQTVADQDWTGTLNLEAGASFIQDGRIDFVVIYTRGELPYTQFFNRESVEMIGFELRGGL